MIVSQISPRSKIVAILAQDFGTREKLYITSDGRFYFWADGGTAEINPDDAFDIAASWGATLRELKDYFEVDTKMALGSSMSD